jgi:hypothetical protein
VILNLHWVLFFKPPLYAVNFNVKLPSATKKNIELNYKMQLILGKVYQSAGGQTKLYFLPSNLTRLTKKEKFGRGKTTLPHLTVLPPGTGSTHASQGTYHIYPNNKEKNTRKYQKAGPALKQLLNLKNSLSNGTYYFNKIQYNQRQAKKEAETYAVGPKSWLGFEPPKGRYKKGGKIPKSGLYKLHKGEVVVPAHRVKTVDKALKKDGKKPLKKVCKNCVLTKNRKVSKK